jgi:hypothetical protein
MREQIAPRSIYLRGDPTLDSFLTVFGVRHFLALGYINNWQANVCLQDLEGQSVRVVNL